MKLKCVQFPQTYDIILTCLISIGNVPNTNMNVFKWHSTQNP